MSTDSVRPRPPRLPAQLEETPNAALEHDATFSDARLSDVAWSHKHAGGVRLQAVRLVNGDLSGSRLEKLGLSDCELTGCELANVEARGTDATRVRIEESRLTGIAFPEGSLRDFLVRGCRVDLASFAFAELIRVAFEDCLMVETSFLGARLQGVRFQGCDLTQADFREASLERCEISGSDLTDLQGVAQLRGAAVDRAGIVANADLWAAALGITVLDAD